MTQINRNMIILVCMSLGMAILVAAILGSRMQDLGENMVEILVTPKDYPAGRTVALNDFTWQAWRKDVLPPHAITKETWAGTEDQTLRLRRGLIAGEPVLRTALLDSGEAGFLAAALRDGYRAASIPVGTETSVAGFVRPGDMVDVILTYEVRLRHNGANDAAQSVVARHASETVLTHLRVLAVDQEIADQGQDAKPGRTVTLEVRPDQVERLALARRMGELSLSLRGMGDESLSNLTDFTSDIDVGRALRAAALAQGGAATERPETASEAGASSAPSPQIQTSTVRLYHGHQSSRISVRGTAQNTQP